MGIKTEFLKNIPLKNLNLWDKNFRDISPEAFARLKNKIKELGVFKPLLAIAGKEDGTYQIIGGNQRLKVYRELGFETADIILFPDLTDNKIITKIALADNQSDGTTDMEQLSALLAEYDLTAADLTDYAVSDKSIYLSDIILDGDKPAEIVEVDLPEEEEITPRVKEGDIWRLGEHLLICADSTERSAINLLMGGLGADLVLTDPPYNMNYQGAGNSEPRRTQKIKNDHLPAKEFEAFLAKIYQNIFAALKEKGSFYVFYKELGKGVFITALERSGLSFKQQLIWLKNQFVLGGAKYQNIYEPCLFGCKGKSIGTWNGGRNKANAIEDFDFMNEEELRSAIKDLMAFLTPDIIRVDKPLKNDLHPTMKPIKLLAHFIENSSKKGDIVLDLFGGSGSTLIACEQLLRRCRAAEIDPHYCDVILTRWEKFTGKTAERVKGA
ncbi:DNA methyltransferase [Candidatus Proelusimicrobium volucris]|uniref:DNA methyltransferase n=1 Tax=Candidatus Proelusimicrobium volucris TaxID=3416225 RepID=UPI003D0DE11A